MGEIYELALIEWGVTPEYINENWTEELLSLLFEKRGQRIERILKNKLGRQKVSDQELFRRAGVTPKQVTVKR